MKIPRHLFFSVLLLSGFIVFWRPLAELLAFSSESSVYSYIPLIPLITICLVYSERRTIFVDPGPACATGAALILGALSLYVVIYSNRWQMPPDHYLSLSSLGVVTFWIGAFVLSYGVHTFRNALFPLLFLALMVPFPEAMLDRVVVALQQSSFKAAYWIFKIIGVKVAASGIVLSLPGLDVAVAKECSGIRSSLSLFITSLLVGHLFLRSPVSKGLLALAALPIAVFKNGVRIVVLSLLTIHVDEGFLSGPLHHQGGIVFFVLALLLLALPLWLLRRFEANPMRADSAGVE